MTDTPNTPTVTDLTPDEKLLIAAIRRGDRGAAAVRLARLAPPDWTYEQRTALAILGRLAVEDALADDTLTSGSVDHVEHLIDAMAEALIDALHVLGCPRELTLAQILDRASSFGGAE